jgi:carbon monoxide dehydrogenase subunit G
MKTTINKTFEVDRPNEVVWDFISDPYKIVTCVPGAKLINQIDEKNYEGTVNMKIGPVVTSFKGKIELTLLDKANYNMEINGQGVDTKGKGSASMVLAAKLDDNGNNTTTVNNTMNISITGKLAQFGSRMIVDVSDQVFKQFLNNFRNQMEAISVDAEPIEKPPVEEAEPINALSLFFASIWASILRLFGKK